MKTHLRNDHRVDAVFLNLGRRLSASLSFLVLMVVAVFLLIGRRLRFSRLVASSQDSSNAVVIAPLPDAVSVSIGMPEPYVTLPRPTAASFRCTCLAAEIRRPSPCA